MKKAILFLLVIAGQVQSATDTYLMGDTDFLKIKDVNRQAESWGTCAATYDITAMFYEDKPNQAKQFKDFANGAELAVIMAHVADSLNRDMSAESFSAMWAYSKTLGDSISETRMTAIAADGESLGGALSEEFLNKLGNTLKVCVNNIKAQQAYIDSWRELAKSGLLVTEE